MSYKYKNILSLTSEEVYDFFLNSEQYHNFELPEYFDFNELLDFVSKSISEKEYDDCINEVGPETLDNVNLNIILNKDGHYAVRPLTLANPFLYCFLVKEICIKGWQPILECFNKFNVPHITSCAIPIVPKKTEAFHKASTILNWWHSMEQRSIELSLEYRYMFVTDITNCYGSINPQTLDWALTFKNTEFESSKNTVLSKNIRRYLCALQQGHNIGIPQGSILFDLVAEIILGYSDLLLSLELEKQQIEGYEIIRYRDDYKIFCNDKGTLERISYILQGVLEKLNFRMNSQKTKISDSIITDSIKKDKLAYIYNTPIFNKKGCDFDGIGKHLLFILMFTRDYPNSGQLPIILGDLDKRINNIINKKEKKSNKWQEVNLDDSEETESANNVFKTVKVYGKSSNPIKENIKALTAICAQIALENIKYSHYALRIASRLLNTLEDDNIKKQIVQNVYNKLCHIPNSEYNQLWLQNITYTSDVRDKLTRYNMPLCKVVMGESPEGIWNNGWVKKEILDGTPFHSIVNLETLKNSSSIITFRERRAYNEAYEQTEHFANDFLQEMEELRKTNFEGYETILTF